MSEYKNVLVAYENQSKNSDGFYLSIQNVSEEEMIIKPGDKIFLNKTPHTVLKNHPKAPHYSKSIKIDDISDEIPM